MTPIEMLGRLGVQGALVSDGAAAVVVASADGMRNPAAHCHETVMCAAYRGFPFRVDGPCSWPSMPFLA